MRSKYLWHSFADSRNLGGDDARVERLGQRQGLIGDSSLLPGPRVVKNSSQGGSAGKKDRCTKGTSCGAACIHADDKCLKEFPEPVTEAVKSVSEILSRRIEQGSLLEEEAEIVISQLKGLDTKQKKSFEAFSELIRQGKVTPDEMEQVANLLASVIITPKQEDRGAARVMSYEEVKAIHESGKLLKLEQAYQASLRGGTFDPNSPGGMAEYIDKYVKQVKISDEVAVLAYGMLPKKARNALNGSGDVTGEGQVFNGYDDKGNIIFGSSGNNARGVLMAQRWMEQKGLDPFTGRFIDLRAGEPEHLFSWEQAKRNGGKGDHPGNLAIAAPQTNNSKATKGVDDDFGKWAKQVERWYNLGPERYEIEEVKPKREEAAAAASKKVGARSEVEKAFNSLTPQERVSTILASAKTYGDRVRYLVIAAGMESGQWGQNIPATRAPRRREMDARATLNLSGKSIKPSAAVLAAAAFLEPSRREAFLAKVDELRIARSPSTAEVKSYSSKDDPRYVSRMKELDKEFEKKLASLIMSVAPDLPSFL